MIDQQYEWIRAMITAWRQIPPQDAHVEPWPPMDSIDGVSGHLLVVAWKASNQDTFDAVAVVTVWLFVCAQSGLAIVVMAGFCAKLAEARNSSYP